MNEWNVFESEEKKRLGGECSHFPNVSLYMTSLDEGRWIDTKIKGTASFTQFIDIDGVPLVCIRLCSQLSEVIFEAEFPFNFKLEKLTDTFTTITCLVNSEYFGFHFNSGAEHCSEFNKIITELHTKLKLNKVDLEDFKAMDEQNK